TSASEWAWLAQPAVSARPAAARSHGLLACGTLAAKQLQALRPRPDLCSALARKGLDPDPETAWDPQRRTNWGERCEHRPLAGARGPPEQRERTQFKEPASACALNSWLAILFCRPPLRTSCAFETGSSPSPPRAGCAPRRQAPRSLRRSKPAAS